MKNATALLVRTVAEPPAGARLVSPEEWVLPLTGAPQVATAHPTPDTPLGAKATVFVHALVEVMSGARPVTQMAAWMSADVYDQLVRRLCIQAREPGPVKRRAAARVMSVHVSMIGNDAAEIAARMVQAGRSRALAIRLERQATTRDAQQWRCTALAWG